jgi:outer membrane protein assembly factor BamB
MLWWQGGVAVAVLGGVLVSEFLTVPHPSVFPAPRKTRWAPRGTPAFGAHETYNDFSVLPVPDGFHTMHVGVTNDDTVWVAGAPVFELAWTAGEEFYIPEGPSVDARGDLYFTPLNPKEDVSLVSLDGTTGRRRWSIPGGGPGYGAPLILNDPEHPGEQLVYHSTFTHAYALRTDGSVVWRVPTGLTFQRVRPGRAKLPQEHMWGMSWHRPSDSVVGLSIHGELFALDRRTGRATAAPFLLPCDPAKPSGDAAPPRAVIAMGNAMTDRSFGKFLDGTSVFERIIETVFGGGSCVSNFYAIDPASGRLFVAAAARDAEDGELDGFAANGALYRLELSQGRFAVTGSALFPGGTGATPTLTPDGKRVVVSDENNHVLALDTDTMQVAWKVDVGAQIAASIAVTADGGEMFAITKKDVIKLVETSPTEARLVWRADLSNAYVARGISNVNALTPTVVANGVAISVAGVRNVGETQILLKVGIALLDRESGKIRNFAEGREESISVTGVMPDGGYYTGASPVRRAVAAYIFGDRLPPLTGGVSRYRVLRHDLLVRDAACAAAARLENARAYLAAVTDATPAAVRDLLMARTLLRQASQALPKQNDMAASHAAQAGDALHAAKGLIDAALASPGPQAIAGAAKPFRAVCELFDE